MPGRIPPGSTVHVVWGGRPLCNFTDKIPEEWPETEFWTRVDELHNITCPTCKTQAERIADARADGKKPATTAKPQ